MDSGAALDTGREPCPDRILDDVGGAFAMGAIGGSAYHFIRGALNSPKGSRFPGGLNNARMCAPRTGGGFAVWGGLFSTFDCTMVYLRQKEDPWNSVAAGAAAGGFLAMRQGPRAALFSAAFGGVLLGFIEGIGIMFNSMNKENPFGMGQPGMQMETPHPPPQPQSMANSAEGSSWGSGLFGWGKKEETMIDGRKRNDELLEGFETPRPPGLYPMLHFPEQVRQQQQQPVANSTERPPSLLSQFFGWGKKQDTTGGGSKIEILESFDTPSQPMAFDYK